MHAQLDGSGKPISIGQLYGYFNKKKSWYNESIIGRAAKVTATGLVTIVVEKITIYDANGECFGQELFTESNQPRAVVIPYKLFPIADSKPDLVQKVLAVCHEINDGRDGDDVFKTIAEEFGELATELAIESGHKRRPAGSDGVFGESVDMLIATIDMIHLVNQAYSGFSDENLIQAINKYAERKLAKWKKAKAV
jgi:hypothetical protein